MLKFRLYDVFCEIPRQDDDGHRKQRHRSREVEVADVPFEQDAADDTADDAADNNPDYGFEIFVMNKHDDLTFILTANAGSIAIIINYNFFMFVSF